MGLFEFYSRAQGVFNEGRKGKIQTKLGAVKQSKSHSILQAWLGEKTQENICERIFLGPQKISTHPETEVVWKERAYKGTQGIGRHVTILLVSWAHIYVKVDPTGHFTCIIGCAYQL